MTRVDIYPEQYDAFDWRATMLGFVVHAIRDDGMSWCGMASGAGGWHLESDLPPCKRCAAKLRKVGAIG